jgi:hypothetical protein
MTRGPTHSLSASPSSPPHFLLLNSKTFFNNSQPPLQFYQQYSFHSFYTHCSFLFLQSFCSFYISVFSHRILENPSPWWGWVQESLRPVRVCIHRFLSVWFLDLSGRHGDRGRSETDHLLWCGCCCCSEGFHFARWFSGRRVSKFKLDGPPRSSSLYLSYMLLMKSCLRFVSPQIRVAGRFSCQNCTRSLGVLSILLSYSTKPVSGISWRVGLQALWNFSCTYPVWSMQKPTRLETRIISRVYTVSPCPRQAYSFLNSRGGHDITF